MYEATIKALLSRGVELKRLGEIVYDLQKDYSTDITEEIALENIHAVLHKREVQHAVLTGIEIDKSVEKGLFDEPILSSISSDEGLYGPDEILALSIVNVYGSIGLTNFGYLDKIKPGIIGEFNDKDLKPGEVHTFLDDILCGICAAASSRYAHNE